MDCSSCGSANRPAARFCDQCGAPLPTRCPSCEAELRVGARFCDQCGSAVVTLGNSRSESDRQGLLVPSDAVRKIVTVLFCDLVGSTAFAEQVDPEAIRDAMGRYHTMAATVIESAGGSVAKYIGDGVMALFGVPEVAEDDALRAVGCGIELQRQFAPIADHIAARYEVEVGLRVGINTGEVVIADDDVDVVGDALNTAARIEAACRPGRVLVGDQTWRLTRFTVASQPLGEVAVKGKREPVSVHEIVTTPANRRAELSAPLVGRVDELSALTTMYERARDERSIKLVTVIGAPGVGKTRLATELGRLVDDEAMALSLRCDPAGSATFAPISDLLLTVAGVASESESEVKLAALDRLIGPAVPDRVQVVERLGSFVGAAEPRSTEESFAAVRRLLEVLGSKHPVVVTIDDIQWAEPLLLDLLEHLAEWVSDAGVLIVGLARPEIRSLRPSLAEGGRRVTAVVPLEGLDPVSTHEFAASLLGVDELPVGLVARLPESTEGNPLFVRELVRMLADDGILVRGGDGYQLTIDAEAIDVPPTIQSLLAARVERLPPDERWLVELASVVGAEFPRGALLALDHELDRSGVAALVEQLRQKELVDPTGAYWGDEPLLRFHHVLIRDAAYRRLLKETRAQLHLRVAHWMEEHAVDTRRGDDVLVAFHLEQAHQYRTDLGLLDDDTSRLGQRAARLLSQAATRALDQDDLAAAGSLALRALALVEPDDGSRADLSLVACEALVSSGELDAGREVLEGLRELGGDARLRAWSDCFDAQLAIFTDPDALEDAAERCLRAAEDLTRIPDHAGVAKARQVRAGALARLGAIGSCEEELDLALAAARTAADRRRVTSVLGAAPPAALWGPSLVARAGGRCLDVIRLLRVTAASPTVEATSIRCQGVLEALRGRFDLARELLATSKDMAEGLGLRHSVLETDLYWGIVELMGGDAEVAEPHLRAAHDGLGTMGIGADAGQAGAYLARSVLQQGRLDEAERLARNAATMAGQNRQTVVAANSVLAEVLATRGLVGEAVPLAELAVAAVERTDLLVDHANALGALGRVLDMSGDEDGAASARRRALALAQQKGAVLDGAGSVPTTASADVGLTGGQGPTNRAVEVLRQWNAIPVTDLGSWSGFLAEDFAHHDRRHGVSYPSSDRAQFLEQIRSLGDLGGNWGEGEPVAIRGERLVLWKTDVLHDGRPTGERFAVIRINDEDLVDLATVYDLDDEASALAELDRLDAEELTQANRVDTSGRDRGPRPTNRAARQVDRLLAAFNRGELELLVDVSSPDLIREDRRPGLELVAPDIVRIDRRRGVAAAKVRNRDEIVAAQEAMNDVGMEIAPGVTGAVRGERFALILTGFVDPGGNTIPIIAVVSQNDEGLLDRLIFYDPEDLAEASRELDRLYLEGDGRSHDAELRPFFDFVDAINRGDDQGIVRFVDDDFIVEDHRPASIGTVGGAEFRHLIAELHDNHDGKLINLIPLVHRVDERGLVVTFERYLRTDQIGEPTWRLHVVLTLGHDRYERAIYYPEHDLAEALERFDEVGAQERARSAGGPPTNRTSPAPNHVFRVVTELLDNANPDDLSAYDRLVAPNVVREDRRSGVADSVMEGRDAMLEMTAAVFDVGFRYDKPELVAVRGERLCLGVAGMVSKTGDQVRFAAVVRTDLDGMLDRFVFFDLDDRAAEAELDRLHAELL